MLDGDLLIDPTTPKNFLLATGSDQYAQVQTPAPSSFFVEATAGKKVALEQKPAITQIT